MQQNAEYRSVGGRGDRLGLFAFHLGSDAGRQCEDGGLVVGLGLVDRCRSNAQRFVFFEVDGRSVSLLVVVG